MSTSERTRSGWLAASHTAGIDPPLEARTSACSTPTSSKTVTASVAHPSMLGATPVASGSERPRPKASKRISRLKEARLSSYRNQLGSSAVSSIEIISPLLNSRTSRGPSPQT
jgi:hypothetical protein